jgi:hypothetical protein
MHGMVGAYGIFTGSVGDSTAEETRFEGLPEVLIAMHEEYAICERRHGFRKSCICKNVYRVSHGVYHPQGQKCTKKWSLSVGRLKSEDNGGTQKTDGR